MGAGGSTAISCSSLDVSNEHYKQSGRHQRVQQQLRQVQEQRMQKYNRKQAADIGRGGDMKQSNSYFDLTTSHLVHLDNNHQLGRQQKHPKTNEHGWFDTNQSETYSLSNADIGASRPIKVLPSQPVVSQINLSGSKCKTNAGVAGRIQMQRQQQRAHELKKFSDSLPSLANIHPVHLMLNQTSSSASKPNDFHQFHANRQQQKQQICSQQQSNKVSAKQHQLLQQNHMNISQQPNHHLVNRNDDSAYPRWQVNSAINADHKSVSGSQQQLIKRAISLSSLHNSHHQQQQQPRMEHMTQVNGVADQYRQQQLVSSKHCHVSSPASNRQLPESMNNYLSRDLQQQPCSKYHNNDHQNHRLHHNDYQVRSQQQPHYNQPTPLAKKILKLKQFANRGGQSSKRYKKQEQQQQQQQRCPVLPPLPRSQSLHELIQLRATENGQRMRTTGTLRGPLGGNGDQPGNKVNLVAELLENRRQQKLNEELSGGAVPDTNKPLGDHNLATLLSQASSSSDDGIHDVSINGDQSTNDSRQRKFLNNNLSDHHHNNRLSLTSEGSERSSERVFRKNSQPDSSKQRRYSHNMNQQPSPQSGGNVHRSNAPRRVENCQKINGKSTLKRSASHSALQASSNNNSNLEDEDENDDLNELAKFLYQFKQRQAAGANGNKHTKEEFTESNRPNHDGRPSTATNSAEVNSQVTNNSFQQSPNSTTSSSGFASSTCTSNSISSSTSSKENNQKLNNRIPMKVNEQESPNNSKLPKKLPSRKKYLAPPRPDEPIKDSCKDSQKSASNNNKCFISGKLKLSSSLLSIVDEYNSTLHNSSGNSNHSPAGANITSVLLSCGQTLACSDASPEPDDDSSGPSSNCSHDRHQLEQLKKYTQLRQMSQSQLALNHLTSSSSASDNLKSNNSSATGKGKRTNGSSSGTPYKSKLINLIRRVSDKSEVANHGRAVVVGSPAATSAASSNSSVGGRLVGRMSKSNASQNERLELSRPGTINQSEMIVPYSKQVVKPDRYSQKVCNEDAQISQNDVLQYAGEIPSGPGKGACLSESLCDLNFDCDFELIKNCGSANEPKGASARQQPQQAALQQAQCNSLLPSQVVGLQTLTPSAVAEAPDRQAQRRQKELAKKHHQPQQQQQLVINSLKGENNWRLGPSSLSLTKPDGQVVANSDCANKSTAAGKQLYQSLEENVKKASSQQKVVCKLHSATTASMDKLAGEQKQQQQRKQPVKLKWSASSWLMNGSGSKTKKQAAGETAGKNCPTKKISSSRTPALPVVGNRENGHLSNHDVANDILKAVGPSSNESASPSAEVGSFANVNIEASQLLYELDHSLDLVSADCVPFSRKSALSWWKMDDQMKRDSFLKDGTGLGLSSDSEGQDDDDDDDDDDGGGDYASLNRAMINATFDADTIIQQHEQQLRSDGSYKIDKSAELSIEPGSPSDSFTFSAPSSPCAPNNNAKQTFASAQDHQKSALNFGAMNSHHRRGLHEQQHPSNKQQVRNQPISTGKPDGNVGETKLELKGLSQVRKFMCDSDHAISNLSTTSAVSVSQPSDSGGRSLASREHQALLASEGASCNLDGKPVVSCVGKQRDGYEADNQDERLRAEEADLKVGDKHGLVPIAASGADDAARCIHELNNKQQHKHLSNTCCALCEPVNCARKREVGTNLLNNDPKRQAKLTTGLGRTLDGSSSNCNNNLDCRCCREMDTGCSLIGNTIVMVGDQTQPTTTDSVTTCISQNNNGHSNIPRWLSDKTNGIGAKSLSSPMPDGKMPISTDKVRQCERWQVTNGVIEQDHCECHKKTKDPLAAYCRGRLYENRPQAGVGAKFEGSNELETVHLMPAEMTKTPTKSTSNLKQVTKTATDLVSGNRFCSVQGQLDEPGQSTCACRHGQTSVVQRQQHHNHLQCEKSSEIPGVKNSYKNMNGQQQVNQCGHSSTASSSSAATEQMNGCCAGLGNNGRQTAISRDNLPATELRAHNCNSGVSDASNKCHHFIGCTQDEAAGRALMCRDLHGNGSKTYCRNRQLASASVVDAELSNTTRAMPDEPENNKLISQQRTSCHCSNLIPPQQLANSNVDDGTDNIIINGQLAAIPSVAGSSFIQQVTPLPGSAEPRNSLPLDSNEGDCPIGGRNNNCNSSSYLYEPERSLLPKFPAESSSQSGDIGLRNGILQQPTRTTCNKLQQQQILDGNCCNRYAEDAITNQDQRAARCKVPICHYPSSKLSQPNYGQDVKCAQACVSGDNPILKTGQKSRNDDDDESGAGAASSSAGDDKSLVMAATKVVSISAGSVSSPAQASSCCLPEHRKGHDNCCCNNNRCRVSAGQPQQLSCEKDGKLIKRFNAAMARFTPHPVHCMGQQQRQLDCTDRLLSKPTKVISVPSVKQQQQPKPVAPHSNPICRSNSELTSNNQGVEHNRKLAQKHAVAPTQNDSNSHNHLRRQQQEQPLLCGKLRSSLLNRKLEARSQLNKGSKLSSSQLSLLSCYNDASFVSPFIGGRFDFSSASNNQLNVDFDDNFILKRKTPNAGLKSRC